ncbi:MAG: hypothetical protein KC493_14205 [Bacteriovoracaceae bacterium]|nr:hypothetical protein [Bacteriovoracaceae bacterium]
MIQKIKEHFQTDFKSGKWIIKVKDPNSWFVFFFCLVWGGGFAGAGTAVFLRKLGVFSFSFSESPEGIGWVIGPLFALIGYVALFIGTSQFFPNYLYISKTSIKKKTNYLIFTRKRFGISKTNLAYITVIDKNASGYHLQAVDPSGESEVLSVSNDKQALEELAKFITEFMELS